MLLPQSMAPFGYCPLSGRFGAARSSNVTVKVDDDGVDVGVGVLVGLAVAVAVGEAVDVGVAVPVGTGTGCAPVGTSRNACPPLLPRPPAPTIRPSSLMPVAWPRCQSVPDGICSCRSMSWPLLVNNAAELPPRGEDHVPTASPRLL